MNAANLPASIAIAGAWGYIGRKFLDAARALGIGTYVLDPGAMPDGIEAESIQRIENENEFYHLPVDFFHLAMHPEDRATALAILLGRPSGPPALILNEKPMACPEHPEACREMMRVTDRAAARMLFDFPELYDGLTRQIVEFLTSQRDLRIHELFLQRSKDREDPDNPRNYKRMVPIQYQESVHCLAYALYLLGCVSGSLHTVLDAGIELHASSELYCPPNPEAYRYAVDGRCDYALTLGDVTITGLTNFKRGACWSKERIIRGTADGQPFLLEVDYLEGGKRLVINGVEQKCDMTADSYQQVIEVAWRWQQECDVGELMNGLYPNPRFARLAYQLSSVLWRSAQDRQPISLDSCGELLAFDARFRGCGQ
jgi:predicted dehydrogenase